MHTIAEADHSSGNASKANSDLTMSEDNYPGPWSINGITPPIAPDPGIGVAPEPLLFFFFSFLAHLRPQALQSVLGPAGPFRHSGESSVPV